MRPARSDDLLACLAGVFPLSMLVLAAGRVGGIPFFRSALAVLLAHDLVHPVPRITVRVLLSENAGPDQDRDGDPEDTFHVQWLPDRRSLTSTRHLRPRRSTVRTGSGGGTDKSGFRWGYRRADTRSRTRW